LRLRRWLVLFGANIALAGSATAQSTEKVWVIGVLSTYARPASFEAHPLYGPLLRRLRELGYFEGKNLRFEWAFADGSDQRLNELAADLVARHVDAIVTAATPGIRASQTATRTIPIVFVGGVDAVKQGFVQSLSHPGGNTTGFSFLIAESTEKQVEILKGFVPRLTRVGYLFSPENPAGVLLAAICRKATEKLGGQMVPLEIRSRDEIETAVATAPTLHVDALVCGTDLFLLDAFALVAKASASHGLPAVGMFPEFADAGGLVAYGPDRTETWGRVAAYLDRIFKGEKAGDLPVEQATKLNLVINRRTAAALGLTAPPQLLVQADRVID